MMGWMAPLRHRGAKLVLLENHQEREPSMSEITTIGLDLAKHVFQVHGVDAQGTTVVRKRLRRGQVLAFFSRILAESEVSQPAGGLPGGGAPPCCRCRMAHCFL